MKYFQSILLVSIMLFLSTISYAQAGKPLKDFLKVPGPIAFEKKSYSLTWSSHPAGNFYKQEYIPVGESVEKFNSMILLDALTGNATIKEIAGAKIAELKKMKEANPIVNYESFDNPKTGEYMIDFLVTANNPDGTVSIAERNVYRYTSFTDKAGNKGILLFGVSIRSYGKDVNPFLVNLKATKKNLVNQVAQFKVPAVSISK